jgi:hypothetical protein
MQNAWSSYLSDNAIEPDIPPVRVRTVFTDTVMSEAQPVVGHTHGLSAAVRSSASSFIDACGANLGLTPTFYQGSKADIRNGRKISRTTLWVKDQDVPPVPYVKEETELLAMVDVDYYIDINQILVENFVPIMLYTFQPAGVAKACGEYKYTFNSDNEVVYSVSGGGQYKHKVWNYSGDSVKVTERYTLFWGLVTLPITKTVCTFSLERRQVDADHQIILFAPLRKYTGFAAIIADTVLQGKQVERLNVAQNGFTRLITNTHDSFVVHTGKVDEYLMCSVDAAHDATLATVARCSKKISLTLCRVKEALERQPKELQENSRPEVLWEFHLSRPCIAPSCVVSTVVPAVRRYQFAPKLSDFDPDAKPSIVDFMKPLVNGAFAPDLSKSNDKVMIEKRVKEIKDGTQLTPFVRKCIAEYVTLFCGGEQHFLRKAEEECVYEKQNRPAQQRILYEADLLEKMNRVVKAFAKREAYQKIADPRNISTINGVDKAAYSRYTYAIADYAKQFKWYAFGKTPQEIATRVSVICSTSQNFIDDTDFARMDGRTGEVIRELELQLFMRIFQRDSHGELFELLRSQMNLPGKTRMGIRYDSGLGRLSGSPETSFGNTNASAFTAYLALRRSRHGSAFYQPIEAWNRLGLYGGDDGFSADIDPDTYIASAAMVGQKLTINVVERGQPGVKFLARCYGPGVWFGDKVSMCDLKRTLSKFHTTVAMPESITNMDKLVDKAYALSLSDSNTPVVGPFVRKVMLHAKPNFVYRNLDGKWNVCEDREVHYPNEPRTWMEDYAQRALSGFSFGAFNDWINQDLDAEELLNCPDFMPAVEPQPTHTQAILDDGNTIIPAMQAAPQCPDAASAAPPRKRTRARKRKEDRPSRATTRPAQPPSQGKKPRSAK